MVEQLNVEERGRLLNLLCDVEVGTARRSTTRRVVMYDYYACREQLQSPLYDKTMVDNGSLNATLAHTTTLDYAI